VLEFSVSKKNLEKEVFINPLGKEMNNLFVNV